ncbi:MAG: hypothetical protein Q9187_005282 [Circinaria calcarea]
MTTRYTQEEWLAIIDRARQELPAERIYYKAPDIGTYYKAPDIGTYYKAPDIGTVEFAKCIDHTLLKLDATKEQIDHLCEEARTYDFKSVCVRLKWVERAVQNLRGTSIVVACVIGFHEGTYSVSEKVREATQAISAGASELDMVLNYKLLMDKEYSAVFTEIAAVRSTISHLTVLKVILETSQLSTTDVIAGCKIAQAAKADYVKTSTGFNGEGATIENVLLMKSVIGDSMKVKASGGVKTVRDVVRMMEAGAERIGTSNGVHIVKEAAELLKNFTHQVGQGPVETTRIWTDY